MPWAMEPGMLARLILLTCVISSIGEAQGLNAAAEPILNGVFLAAGWVPMGGIPCPATCLGGAMQHGSVSCRHAR